MLAGAILLRMRNFYACQGRETSAIHAMDGETAIPGGETVAFYSSVRGVSKALLGGGGGGGGNSF